MRASTCGRSLVPLTSRSLSVVGRDASVGISSRQPALRSDRRSSVPSASAPTTPSRSTGTPKDCSSRAAWAAPPGCSSLTLSRQSAAHSSAPASAAATHRVRSSIRSPTTATRMSAAASSHRTDCSRMPALRCRSVDDDSRATTAGQVLNAPRRLLEGAQTAGPPPQHRLQFLDEVVDVFKLAVHRRKPHKRHLVHFPQGIEHPLADDPRGDFPLEILVNVRLDLADDPLDVVGADRPFVARLLQPRADLLPVERHARPVFLDHLQRRFFDLFVGRVPPAAFQTLATPADYELLTAARVHNLGFPVTAEWTHHERSLPGDLFTPNPHASVDDRLPPEQRRRLTRRGARLTESAQSPLWEGEAPAEPRGQLRPHPSLRLGRSLALPPHR